MAQFLTAHGVKAAAYHAGKHMKVCTPPQLAQRHTNTLRYPDSTIADNEALVLLHK